MKTLLTLIAMVMLISVGARAQDSFDFETQPIDISGNYSSQAPSAADQMRKYRERLEKQNELMMRKKMEQIRMQQEVELMKALQKKMNSITKQIQNM